MPLAEASPGRNLDCLAERQSWPMGCTVSHEGQNKRPQHSNAHELRRSVGDDQPPRCFVSQELLTEKTLNPFNASDNNKRPCQEIPAGASFSVDAVELAARGVLA